MAKADPTFGLSNESFGVASGPVKMDHLLGAHLLLGDVGDHPSVSVEVLISLGKEARLLNRLSPKNQPKGVVRPRLGNWDYQELSTPI